MVPMEDNNGQLCVFNAGGVMLELPKVCPICGEAEELKKCVVRASMWPKVLLCLIAAGILPFIIAVLLTEKKCPVTFYACKEHHKALNKKFYLWISGLFVSLAFLLAGLAFGLTWLTYLGIGVAGLAIPCFWLVQPLNIMEFNEGKFTFAELPSEVMMAEKSKQPKRQFRR